MEVKAVIINDSKEKLQLEYPCNWNYKIITHAPHAVDEIITSVVVNRSYEKRLSNTSKTGTYHSFDVTLLVHSDEDRGMLFESFKQHELIKMVL
jgi:putative lipoic acid-binding regulatory protein